MTTTAVIGVSWVRWRLRECGTAILLVRGDPSSGAGADRPPTRPGKGAAAPGAPKSLVRQGFGPGMLQRNKIRPFPLDFIGRRPKM
ncbi:MAG TPA: hypothetical protein VLY46_09845, partial [Usitatibacter sp.]|nr:hypothetical protein [Usitatibacter sp.]